MIKSLRDARLVDALPRVVKSQDWVKAMSETVGYFTEKTLTFADNSQIYTALDTVPENVLDALAVGWKIDWYDTSYSVEKKRRIVKTAMEIRRLMGTVRAVKLQADAIYPGTMVEEWFEYDGEAGYYRLVIDVTDSNSNNPVISITDDEAERQLALSKRWSMHLEHLSYMIRHAIKTKAIIDNWLYPVPKCGTIRCGTWWMPSTLGWSESHKLNTPPAIDPFNAHPDLTGTLPVVSRVGYSACGTLRTGGLAEAYTASPTEVGANKAGTIPQASTLGWSEKHSVTAEHEIDSYNASQDEAGKNKSGTLPETSTAGWSVSEGIKLSADEAGGFTTILPTSGTCRCGDV